MPFSLLASGIQLDGASDYGVSEAIYLPARPGRNGLGLYFIPAVGTGVRIGSVTISNDGFLAKMGSKMVN